MHARVWQLRIRPGKLDEFQNEMSSLVRLARQQAGYRGILALKAGSEGTPDVSLIAVWESHEAVRASEENLFLMQAISRYLACCEGMPNVIEKEVLASDFIALAAAG